MLDEYRQPSSEDSGSTVRVDRGATVVDAMNWPNGKFVTLDDGIIKCKDCNLITFHIETANRHNCDLGRMMLARLPKPTPKKPIVVKETLAQRFF